MKLNLFSAPSLCLSGLALLLALTAVAQQDPAPRGDQPRPPATPRGAPDRSRMPGGEMGAGMGAGMAMGGFMPMLGILNEEQRESMRQQMQAGREEMRQIEERLRTARRELTEVSLHRPFDEAKVREKAMAQAKAEADLSVLRARALSRVQPPLSEDQIERMKNPPRPNFAPQRPPMEEGQAPRNRQTAPRDQNDLPPRNTPPPAAPAR